MCGGLVKIWLRWPPIIQPETQSLSFRMNKNPSCGVFKPQAAHSMVINHPKLKVWADNIHSDEDKWSLCNMQMPKGYSTETAVFQYYLYWRISHITQFCWVFQQSVCWTEKNQICNVKMRGFERQAQCGALLCLHWPVSHDRKYHTESLFERLHGGIHRSKVH